MAKYYDARGYISCDFDQIREIRAFVEAYGYDAEEWRREKSRLNLYKAGWLYQAERINWVGHVFYGASVQMDGVDLLRGCLRELAAQFPDVEGVFVVDDEEAEFHESIKLTNGEVYINRT